MNKYFVTIGLEMHCEISKTNTKVFSSAKNEFDELQNSNIRPVDMAFPGTLPRVNKKCVEMALEMSLILNCKQPQYLYFERKNYYYPDLPKGYQITQNTKPIPIGMDGFIDIPYKEDTLRVYIDNIHLEEDAASMEHNFSTSCIDYNRAGVPLLELVTTPCLHNASEAVAFLEYMRSIYQYCDISEADSKKGQIRCDVNVSISDDEFTLGTKVEVKNVNSFSSVYDVINYEIERQSNLKDNGRYDEVVQETRRFDEETGTTISMRSKVDSEDYKYFVEPNIPKYKITKDLIENVKRLIPILPLERKMNYINNYHLSDYDATIIVKEKQYAVYYEDCLKLGIDPKIAANWLTVNILGYLNKENIDISDFFITPLRLKAIIDKVTDSTISSKQAKDIFNKCLEEKNEPSKYITSENAQISDKNTLLEIIEKIISTNEAQVNAYKNGRTNLFEFFVGNVMKETKGKANPVLTRELIKEALEK